MARSADNSTRWLLVTSAGLIALSLLPAGWLWWLNDVAAIVNLPLAPLTDLSNRARAKLRPGDDPLAVAPEIIERLTSESDRYRALWREERRLNEDLIAQLADIRLAEQFDAGARFDPIRADVVGRGPDALRGAVRLNVGTRSGVAAGDVAVFRGAHLVGRVADDPAWLTSLLVPTTDPAIGRMHAAIAPDPEPADPRPASIPLLLTPVGDGTFTADADHDAKIAIGDDVACVDPAWKATARGMIVGVVESIERRDDQPLRRRLRIRPRYDAQHLASVVVKATASPVEQQDDPRDQAESPAAAPRRGGAKGSP